MVIGAGLPRTGTLSMRAALSQLLDGACYHGADVLQGNRADIRHWKKAFGQGVTPQEWVNFFEGNGYRAGVDFPCGIFYK